MKIVDTKGKVLKTQPDLTKGRYLEKEGDPDTLVYTPYTDEELAEQEEAMAADPVTTLQMAVADLYEQLATIAAASAGTTTAE